MPNQFKCNNENSKDSDKIDSFNAVYDYYYTNVIKNPTKASVTFDAAKIGEVNGKCWSSLYCDTHGCPSNISKDTVSQSLFFTDNGGNISITNKDLAKYLDDCASKIYLDKNSSTYYGPGVGNRYSKTMTLRDVSYNSVLMDRSDLDRKMKEAEFRSGENTGRRDREDRR
jgi:hypothetical protein